MTDTNKSKLVNEKFTLFWDMHSGGYAKTDFDKIFIENGNENPNVFFESFFGENPNDIGCSCCGSNFSVSEEESIEKVFDFCGKYGSGDEIIIITQEDIRHLANTSEEM